MTTAERTPDAPEGDDRPTHRSPGRPGFDEDEAPPQPEPPIAEPPRPEHPIADPPRRRPGARPEHPIVDPPGPEPTGA